VLHIGAGVKTYLTHHDIGGERLMLLHIGAGVKTLSYTDIGVWTPYVTHDRGRGINLILH
jgi:hypothetical protein